jgi:EAL domain-containing protein (putative c-di-GMP-specific phosphodiesterase class I)
MAQSLPIEILLALRRRAGRVADFVRYPHAPPAQLHAIKRLGVELAIDDFGTGYSSLNYLNRFPIDRLKIDRSFVRDMLEDPTDLAITRAIIGLGHTLGLKVVAEGVETDREAQTLRAWECDELQGYLFARPMPAQELSRWMGGRRLRLA